MSVFEHEAFRDHERVVFCREPEVGLRAIIAIHDTTLGPAAGGCRMWPYGSSEEALTDVLRLAQAMSYKNALAGLALGGGKSVIIADARCAKTPALLHAFARAVEELGGRYYTAEDIGIGMADVETLGEVTRYVFGHSREGGSGDPSPFTARGGFEGIRAAVRHRLGRDDLEGLGVALQGVGNVGYALAALLSSAGARLIVADTERANRERAQKEFGAKAVEASVIHSQDADVFAPCAMGAVLNDATIPEIKAPIVAGVANNQLAEERHGRALRDRGILYAPDYVVNAGGMLSGARDILQDYGVDEVNRRIDGIYDTVLEIFRRSEKEGLAPNEVADALAREKLASEKIMGARKGT